MLAIIENLFSRDSSRNHSHVTLGRFSRLQAYLVRFGRDCKYIRSPSGSRLQPYLVPAVTLIASIFGLALYLGFGRASKSFCPLHGEVYGQTVFRHFPPSIRKYPPSFWHTNVIGHEEWNDEVHFGSKW